MKFQIFMAFFLFFKLVEPDKILVLTFFSSKSHKITYMRLIEELALRGHKITVVTPIKADKPFPNITEVLTLDLDAMLDGKWNPFESKEQNQDTSPFLLTDLFRPICRESYDLPQVKAILNQSYDAIFIQPLFNDCVLGIVYRLKAPLILFFPTGVPAFLADRMGSHFPPSFVPNLFSSHTDEMNFLQRFVNFGMTMVYNAIIRYHYEPFAASVYREKLGHDIPDVEEILGNASLILSNGHFSLHRPKPYLPDIIDVGGIHSKEAKPLPKDLENFVSQGKDGFIYFSMGSATKGDLMPEKKRQMFLSVFSKLKQQVLWKWESETMPNLPLNVKLSKWLPQQDLLGHKDIRLFITHCGGGSTEEAIFHGVPLIGLPLFGDQVMNSKNAKSHGIMISMDWNELTEESLMREIQEILTNKRYRENAKKLSTIFRDQPDDPLSRGVYWVEYVLRHKGAPHLRSPARKLNFVQYHSLDVIFAYFIIILIIGYLIFILFTILTRFVKKIRKHLKASNNKKTE